MRRLRLRDQEVRVHERAHATAGGRYAGSPRYEYERGPDGRQYAIGGSVSIDTAPVPNDPEATLEKMRVVRRAALSPAQPSPEDRRIAAEAGRAEAEARSELAAMDRNAARPSEPGAGADRESRPGPPADPNAATSSDGGEPGGMAARLVQPRQYLGLSRYNAEAPPRRDLGVL